MDAEVETVYGESDTDSSSDGDFVSMHTIIEELVSSEHTQSLKDDQTYWIDISIDVILNHPFELFQGKHLKMTSVT